MLSYLRLPPVRRATFFVLAVALGASSVFIGPTRPARAADYATILGSGSSWAANAVSDWVSNGKKFGWQVNYTASGSSTGRSDFLTDQVDFAVSDIPFQFNPTDGSKAEAPAAGSYAYMPIVAGGTSFMYNLKIGGKQVTNLRLSGQNIARIFTGQVKTWNDAQIQADNPGLTLPATTVVPVVRQDGSGSSAQFSLWMDNQYPDLWRATYTPGGETSLWPTLPGGIRKTGDDGVSQFVQSSYGDGGIGYVQYSYAKNAGFPVAKMLNKAGYYVEPTPQNVAVALLQAQINQDAANPATYLTQQLPGVYNDQDPRTYPLSAYSYMILPMAGRSPPLAAAKAATLGAFGKFLLCDGQDSMDRLGYSPLPLNLVTAAFAQLKASPGTNVGDVPIQSCKNPTFSPDGTNKLATTAPFPQACDKQGPAQCADGTGGAPQSTTVKPAAAAAAASGSAAGTAVAGAATDAAAVASVDPETGLEVGGAANGAAVPLAGPVSLNRDGAGGWSGSQTFAVLAGLLLLAVFVLPPLLVKRLSRDGGGA